ncbi:Hypothetical protein A7982_08384 [Minicystis rosea]|nr:Hypothetical protein A7982_08384 [Minicystis rosea]
MPALIPPSTTTKLAPFTRAARSLFRTSLCTVAAGLASLPFTSPLAIDPLLPRHDRPGGISLAYRKDNAPPAGEPEPLPTLGTIFNLHTNEAVVLSETEPAPDRFSDLLADKALRGRVDVAPELIGVLRTLVRARPPARVEIVSGYRSPKRNEMMRKKGRHVASHSQHTMGHAVDFRVEGMSVGDVVRAVEAMKWKGGMGRYDAKSDLFVHVDVGPNRRWKGK